MAHSEKNPRKVSKIKASGDFSMSEGEGKNTKNLVLLGSYYVCKMIAKGCLKTKMIARMIAKPKFFLHI